MLISKKAWIIVLVLTAGNMAAEFMLTGRVTLPLSVMAILAAFTFVWAVSCLEDTMGRTRLKVIREELFTEGRHVVPLWMVLLIGAGGMALWVSLSISAFMHVRGASYTTIGAPAVFLFGVILSALLAVAVMILAALTVRLIFKLMDRVNATHQDTAAVQPEEGENRGFMGLMPPSRFDDWAWLVTVCLFTFPLVLIVFPVFQITVLGMSTESVEKYPRWLHYISVFTAPVLACVPAMWIFRYCNPPLKEQGNGE